MTDKVALGGNFLLLLLLEQEENYDSSSSYSAEEETELSDDISANTIVEPMLLVPQRRPIPGERVSNHFKRVLICSKGGECYPFYEYLLSG